ncbi:MAG: type II CRISPR-associated endonuclease Cas1 [Flavobacteriales bacterium]|nr:type II CRISPR-associated endonuclease Cas1 [Flavobacteriales bacterium]MCW8912225.1 type II CRISPR-associated endonuclease Cas1 [Flavobacteriales bacterium]MCW8936892.1 type II CRISPR-associated endonuclease Cas1 [Flavobacteriales bacterium]MCW8941219.1 type II CRISPR-associated endonuclease Cas1 [Flavobacteriales bacterium]MCW8968917.1 type II CRISPR-associated endonuclease Cas1 [Flavobacteriales bacterium]
MIKRTLFFGNKSSLTTRNEQLIIKTNEKEASVPIEDIGFVVIENQESYISLPTINKLINNNVAVIFCNEKHMPSSMLMNLDGHHLQHEFFKAQINASEPLKKQLWQQTVKSKIQHQAQLLEKIGQANTPLNYYASKVLSGDSDNREGAAAAYYWKHIFDFDFKRERYGEHPNAFLNYGYIVLRAAVARALAGSGLLNTIGIHHRNKYNAFCLADDIMEPYRPLVDIKVLEIINNYDTTELTTEIKVELLSILTQSVYYQNQVSPLMVALNKTTSSLQQCFAGSSKKIIYPKLWN